MAMCKVVVSLGNLCCVQKFFPLHRKAWKLKNLVVCVCVCVCTCALQEASQYQYQMVAMGVLQYTMCNVLSNDGSVALFRMW